MVIIWDGHVLKMIERESRNDFMIRMARAAVEEMRGLQMMVGMIRDQRG